MSPGHEDKTSNLSRKLDVETGTKGMAQAPKLRIVEEIDQTWSLMDIVTRRAPSGWTEVFRDAMPEFQDLEEILQRWGNFVPLKKNLFRAFELTPLAHVSVVLVGQDPYHQIVNIRGQKVPRAQGLSFSVDRDDEIPSSLQNIYKEMARSMPEFHTPLHGDLTAWALQGVLMLNMSLTTSPGVAGAHGQIWMGFISKVLAAINEQRPGTIFILLGKEAQRLRTMIGEKGIILESSHPSGLSAHRGFLGSNIFVRTNKLLAQAGRPVINWQIE